MMIVAPPAFAATGIPLFRHALQHWPADPYPVVVFHRGRLAAEDDKLVEILRTFARGPGPAANYTVETVNVARSLPASWQALWQAQANPPLPWMVLRYPASAGPEQPVWAGPFNRENARLLMDSPARRAIARYILQGGAGVWVVLESGDARQDESAIRLLRAEPSSPIVRPARNDSAEMMFVALLQNSRREAPRTETAVFPVFGRGRTLPPLAGPEITAAALRRVANSLTSPVSRPEKGNNPGLDLLLAADWEAAVEGRTPREPATPLPAAESVPIPSSGARSASPAAIGQIEQQNSTAVPPHRLRPWLLAGAALAGLLVLVTGALALRSTRHRIPKG